MPAVRLIWNTRCEDEAAHLWGCEVIRPIRPLWRLRNSLRKPAQNQPNPHTGSGRKKHRKTQGNNSFNSSKPWPVLTRKSVAGFNPRNDNAQTPKHTVALQKNSGSSCHRNRRHQQTPR